MAKLVLRQCLLLVAIALLAACNDNSPQPAAAADSRQITRQDSARILVTGVTGRQGGAVARALLEKGFRVRGLTRDPQSQSAKQMAGLGVELVKGDYDKADTLDAAMEDVHGVFAMTDFWEHGYDGELRHGRNIIDAAARKGVKHLVYSSVANADQQTGIPHFDSKYEVERALVASAVPWTILRPVSFMENWEYRRDSIIAGKLYTPFSEATRLQQISVRDIGRFVALAFSAPDDWIGRSLDIAAQSYTVRQVIDTFSRVTGSPVEFVQVPWNEYEEKQGPEMTVMDRWIEGTGYSANINLVRSYLPDMLTLEEYLYQAGW